ncbi:MAG: nucleoside-diphosphate kinase [Candidatus Bathyarchaeia archaeon]
MQRTFVMLKPETVVSKQIGEIIAFIEKEGFAINAMKLTRATKHQAEKLYEPHVGKGFYQELIEHVLSGPVVPMIVEAPDAILKMRNLIGPTNPSQGDKSTIRARYGQSVTKNAIHASDSPANAEREGRIFFDADDFG